MELREVWHSCLGVLLFSFSFSSPSHLRMLNVLSAVMMNIICSQLSSWFRHQGCAGVSNVARSHLPVPVVQLRGETVWLVY